MKRRTFVQTSGAAAAATATTGLSQDSNRPNLVIVHCDELNFRTIGCYRDTLPEDQAFMWGKDAVCETPHIDSIAKDGAICTKFYAATPVCSPSRSTFLSGQYSQNTPVTNNNVHLSDDVITFAHKLGQAGYATGYAGKWHLDGNGKPQWAPERNFGFEDNRYMFNRGHWKQFEIVDGKPRVKARGKDGRASYDVKGSDEKSFATDWLVDRTIEFIDEKKDAGPFAYMVSIPDPHGPDTVRAPYDTKYSDEKVQKPVTFDKDANSAPSWAKPQQKCNYKMASYHGMMKCIDDNVGKLIAALKERGIYDNTILIFTADHGDMRGEHRRQNKGIPLEASAKVPFVIRLPEKIASGSQIDRAMNTTDFMPTILNLMGVERSGKEEGRDLAALFTGGEVKGEDITFMRSTGKPGDTKGWISAVNPRYKLILSDQDDPWLLDLETDPNELRNFIAEPEKEEVVKTLAGALKKYGTATKDPYLDHPHTGGELEKLMS
ncbi:MAG: sulfatase [Verrucomicrobiales bacterium]|nr:sulfatase [Verrucomicrobiales bacterium]